MQVQTTTQNKSLESWVKILSKGLITIPKDIREALGLREGEVAKVRVQGNQLIIESREAADYRVYSTEQIDQMVKEDQLPKAQANELEKYWSDIP